MRSVAAVAACLVPVLALANGRPPITNGVKFRPGDPGSLYVATTFGLLISRDDGCSFRWICEQNLGYAGTYDPQYRIAADGAIFATTFTGLRVSRDGGCSFTTATADKPIGDPGRIADIWISALDIGPTGEVWVATAETGRTNNIYRSTDNGVTFEPRSMLSPTIWWRSIAVAPSRAQRVYATGYQVASALLEAGPPPPTTYLQISDDSGENWRTSPLAGVALGIMPLVLVVGVDRDNPDVVLMSSVGSNPPAGDRLYRSTDGGTMWREVLATTASIIDVSVGKSGRVFVATLGGGTFQSINGGASFDALVNAPQLACVGQREDGELFGCGANWQPDFKAVAKSADAATWNKVFRFVELAGPLECPAGTPQADTCGGLWPAVQEQFGTTGPTCGAPEPAPEPAPDVTQPRPSGGGCCGASNGSLGATALLAALCGALTLRRRRRSVLS
jgi:hypothetical protein